MSIQQRLLGLAVWLGALTAIGEPSEFLFEDVSDSAGLSDHLAGIMGHAAAWGDVNGDGAPDLFVGTFADRPEEDYIAGGAKGPVPNQLFLNRDGHFEPAQPKTVHWLGRASGAVFADLDNNGYPDLYVTNNGRLGHENLLYWNRQGTLAPADREKTGAPMHLPEVARSATALDIDGDGLLDLMVLATLNKGPSMLFRNLGQGRFETTDLLPEDLVGLGVAAGDLSGNGWPDVFVGGPNRVFENREGVLKEVHLPGIAAPFDGEDRAVTCGVALGDVDGDGDLDVLLGTHTKRPWVDPAPLRLLINESRDGNLLLTDQTEALNLPPYPMRAPHVEIRDFDNDGRPDLYASVVTFSKGRVYPAILRNLGPDSEGRPRFAETAFVHRPDFPDPDDYQPGDRSGVFYDKLVKRRKLMYFAPGPSADVNRDGRIDLFLASWFPQSPSLLLENRTKAGHYLQVKLTGRGRLNRMGVGAIVRAYRTGHAGQPDALLATDAISVVNGYCSGQEPIAHLGLGEHPHCDLVLTLPYGLGKITREGLPADQVVLIQGP